MYEEDLLKFTDVLDEICDSQPLEICDSQPLSLTSSNITPPRQEDPLPKSHRPPKCTGQVGNFRSVEEIDPKYQHVFTYRYFNVVQSSVIEDALYSNKSIVVCAPTGSGKTVVFEMAIVQLLMELEDRNYTGDFKIIYMAPVKALCTERLTEWHSKFTKLGLLCIEVTGDTDVEFSQLQPYRIIITTPEKWDMLTRRWKDHRGLVESIKLFLIDEVHILNDEVRGPVLEAVVSRMKTIETSVLTAHRIEQLQAQFQGADVQCKESPTRIRFVAVSATVSNPEDVAAWLGNSEKPAAYYKFGDECRPVKLKRVVEGYPCPIGTSIFKFDITLNYKLWPIIQRYHNGKPTLIFCNTRKGVQLTAEALSREITISFNEEQKAKLVALASTFKNKKVQSLVLCGVGCHHAGLLYQERTNIEQAFRNRDLPILITTTTLAMGVNLPAHLVIIKNTQQYVTGGYQEYSMSTVLQMIGRAGRPQYDTEATAVIMTRQQDKARYQALVGGCEPLQSYLHKRLAENLNSEAALGTVCDVAQCVQWVNSTFLRVRAARDPKRYLSLPPAAPSELISKKIEELCVRAMNGLASSGLITMDEISCIESTEAGRLMSLYYLDLETMKLIMKSSHYLRNVEQLDCLNVNVMVKPMIMDFCKFGDNFVDVFNFQLEGTESLERLLWLVCESHELSDMHLRVDERRSLNALNRNNAAATIRFPMKGKINSRQMKLSCVIQAILGCLPIADPSLNQEAMKIMRTADRVCKCLVSYVTRPNLISQNPKFYSAILNSLILAKCISAHLWENSPYVCRQLKGIGPTYSTLLASAGKTNFMVLEESHPRDLERIMNKGPPTGNILRKQISLLPKYNLTMTPVSETIVRIQLTLLNQAHLNENMENLTAGANHKSYVVVGDSENYLLHFTTFKESDLINVYDGCMTFEVTRKHTGEHKVFAHCISSAFVGIDEKCEYSFMDISPLSEINIKDFQSSATDTLEIHHQIHQTTITDVFREKKRKIFNQNDSFQSKEKKKRGNNLVRTLNSLKKSLEKTAEENKEDFNKQSDISLNLLQNLSQTPLNKTSLPEIRNDQYENQSFENVFSGDFEMDDIDIDEEQVKGILSEIENEIKDGKSANSETLRTQNKSPNHNQFSYFHKRDPVKYNYKRQAESCKNMNIPASRRKLSTKNNYSFLDMLDKRNSNDDNISETNSEAGFSETVKPQIEKCLQRAQDKFKIKNPILLNVIDSSNTKAKNINSTDPIILAKDDSLQSSEDKTDNNVHILNSIVQYENKLPLNTKQFHENPYESKDIIIDGSSQTHEKETDRISNSVVTDEKKHHINAEKYQFHETIDKQKMMLPKTDIHLRSSSNLIPDQCLEVMSCNNAINEIADSIGFQNPNLKDIILEDTAQTGQTKIKKCATPTFVPRFNVARLNEFTTPVNNEVQINAPVNNKPHFIQNKLILKNTNNLHNHGDNNDSESNSFETPTSHENIENIRRYSFAQTKTFNISTTTHSKQQVQIISKLKVDLDVTEIVYKKDELSPKTNEVSIVHARYPKTVAMEAQCETTTSDNDHNKKVTTHQNSTNERLNEVVRSSIDFNGSYSKMNTCQLNIPVQNNDKCRILYGYNKENTFFKDGLRKHKNTFKRQNNSIYEIQKINRGAKYSRQSPNVLIAKSKRKYNLSDTDNLKIPSHEIRAVEKNNIVSLLTQRDNLMEKVSSENDLDTQNSPKNQSDCMERKSSHFYISKDIEEDGLHMQPQDVMLRSLNSQDNNLNQDIEEIIPPPSEFCDDNVITNSSKLSDNFHDYILSPENSSEKQYLTGNLTKDKFNPGLFKNIQSIPDNKKTVLNEKILYNTKDTITSNNNSNNASVKDILQKYSNIYKMQKSINTNINLESKMNKFERSDSNAQRGMVQNNRKYKIRDLDNITIPLPQILINVENHNNTSQKMKTQNNTASQKITQRVNINTEVAYENYNEIQQNRINEQTVLIQDYSNEISSSDISSDDAAEVLKIPSPDTMLSPLYYDINQTILNPKTLLERMNKDKITTSPRVFCDDNTSSYSPIYTTDNENFCIYEIQKINRGAKYSRQSPNVLIAKSKRKYNLTDTDNLKIPSHEIRAVEKNNIVSLLTQRDNLMEKVSSENDLDTQNSPKNQSDCMERKSSHFYISKDIEEDGLQMQTQDVMLRSLNSQDNNLNQDIEEIIPPPWEFCDDNVITNSSKLSDNFHDYILSPENSSEKQYLTGNLTKDKFNPGLFKNIQSIPDNKKTVLNEKILYNTKDTITSNNNSNNASVKDILQKYSNIYKMQTSINANINLESKMNKFERSDNNAQRGMVQNNRKYKIRDLDNITIPLPQILINVKNHNNTSQKMKTQNNTASQKITQRANINTEVAYEKYNEIQQNRINEQTVLIQDYSNEISSSDISSDDAAEVLKIPSTDTMLSPLYYDINQTILNPKTLLERMNKDKITTSPRVFCDDNTSSYSPIYTTDNENAEEINTQDYKDSPQNNFDTFETSKVFDSDSVVDLTPSKEVETWTLSQDLQSGLLNYSDTSFRYSNCYTTLRKNCTKSQRELQKSGFYPNNNSRKAKLSYFKFERKRGFKKI